MTIFRPCIDLHQGKVKQIVGASFTDSGNNLKTNFISQRPSSWYAELFKKDGLKGGHVIKLGEGNEKAALEALQAYPGGLQIGGGINPDNAEYYLKNGASHVITTSWIFPGLSLDWERLRGLSSRIEKKLLVLDLSCRKMGNSWFISKNKWQTVTDEEITEPLLHKLQEYCGEFLIHAANVEGKCLGIDRELVEFLGRAVEIPATYAGGAKQLSDLDTVKRLSHGKVDLTVGSALDIYGGNLIKYQDCVEFNQSQKEGT